MEHNPVDEKPKGYVIEILRMIRDLDNTKLALLLMAALAATLIYVIWQMSSGA